MTALKNFALFIRKEVHCLQVLPKFTIGHNFLMISFLNPNIRKPNLKIK